MLYRGKLAYQLDGTLAKYIKYSGPKDIGAPVQKMLRHALKHMGEGYEIVIFSERVGPLFTHDEGSLAWKDAQLALKAIKKWSATHFGKELKVTAVMDVTVKTYFATNARRIELNTGCLLSTKPVNPDYSGK